MNVVISALILAWIAIGILAFAVAGLLGQIRELRHNRGDVGSFMGSERTIDRRRIPAALTLALRRANADDSRSVLLFASPACPTCNEVLQFMRSVVQDDTTMKAVVVIKGSIGAYPHLRGPWKVMDDAGDVFTEMGVLATPAMAGIDPSSGFIDYYGPVGSLELARRVFDGFANERSVR